MGMFSFGSNKKKRAYGQGGGAHYQQKGFLSGLGFGSFSSSDRKRAAYGQQVGYGQPAPMGHAPAPQTAVPVAAAAPSQGACAQCGSALPAGAKFCLQCGTRVQQAGSFCASCGTQLPTGAKFCPSCGTPR